MGHNIRIIMHDCLSTNKIKQCSRETGTIVICLIEGNEEQARHLKEMDAREYEKRYPEEEPENIIYTYFTNYPLNDNYRSVYDWAKRNFQEVPEDNVVQFKS